MTNISAKTKKSRSLSGHQSARSKSTTYITPAGIIVALGEFDLDPCTPPVMPWQTAKHRYTIVEDGLKQKWFGRIWLNPPFGNIESKPWLERMCDHKNGVLLFPARTETKNFEKFIWTCANSILFLGYRPHFHATDGSRLPYNSGAPVIIAAYGDNNDQILRNSELPGTYIRLKQTADIFIITPGKTSAELSWLTVVSMAVSELGDKDMQRIYDFVMNKSPQKCRKNPWYREKIRQKVQEIRLRGCNIMFKN